MRIFQKIGKSLMLPVSVMPVAAILKGIGYWIDPVGQGSENIIAAFLMEAGGAIIDLLPLLFAVSVAWEMSKDRNATVVLSAIIAYTLISVLLSPKCISLIMGQEVEQVHIAFENSSNVFIGILSGAITSFCYNHFSNIKFPAVFSFFEGRRFVPIITSVIMMAISAMMMIVWPFFFQLLVGFGEIISGMGAIGAGLYGFFNRILVATGLHHALNSVFWFDGAGINDIGKFWGTVSGGVQGVTGMYQAGFFPIMMFGLPGAALAMYKCSYFENRKELKALFISSAFASFLTGVTEPIEFSFMFVAPVLYVIHAVLTGVSMFIAAQFQWLAGFGFSAGFIDYFLSIKSPFAHNIFMLIPLGVVFSFIYYYVFKFVILKFDLKTPGRDLNNDTLLQTKEYDHTELALMIVDSLGGRKNIIKVDTCLTRLRIEVKDISHVDETELIKAGITNIMKFGRHDLQIVLGTEVQFVVEIINDILM